MVDWAIAHRKGMMECSAEGIYLGIIGWAASVVCWFILTAASVIATAASLVALVICGGLPKLVTDGANQPAVRKIDRWGKLYRAISPIGPQNGIFDLRFFCPF